MVTKTELFESPNVTLLDFLLWGWMKSRVHERKVDTRDELLACISDAAACIRERDSHINQKHRIIMHELQSAMSGGVFEQSF